MNNTNQKILNAPYILCSCHRVYKRRSNLQATIETLHSSRHAIAPLGIFFFFSPKALMKECGLLRLERRADRKETCKKGGSSRGHTAPLCSYMLMSFGNAMAENLFAGFEVSIKRFISAEKVFI